MLNLDAVADSMRLCFTEGLKKQLGRKSILLDPEYYRLAEIKEHRLDIQGAWLLAGAVDQYDYES